MSLHISITRSKQARPKPPASDLGFGRFFTDHMFLADCDGGAWSHGRVVPYGPLALDPAAAALHYGQTLFEGMKAYRSKKGRALVFRPGLHAARLNASAKRLCMPALPEAHKLSAKAANVGFDWPNVDGLFDKLREGSYTLWVNDVARARDVKVKGAAIAELDWTGEAVA